VEQLTLERRLDAVRKNSWRLFRQGDVRFRCLVFDNVASRGRKTKLSREEIAALVHANDQAVGLGLEAGIQVALADTACGMQEESARR